MPNLYQWQRMKPHHYIGEWTDNPVSPSWGVSRDMGCQQIGLSPSCSEEKAKLLREMMAKIEDKNEVLE